MGVVNVTPDSFSDGGLFLKAGAAVAHARGLIGDGADIVDVGGESTRPGADPVPAQEELRRVLPVLEGIAALDFPSPVRGEPGAGNARARPEVSIDTSKAIVARAALSAGASFVNDVSALRADPEMAGVVAESGAECCLMHMLGDPRTMQEDPRYADVVDDVKAFLAERMEFAVGEGISEERIVLDPGIGFGKTVAHNLELLDRLDELTTLGRPLLVGTSRKSFLGRVTAKDGGASPDGEIAERLGGTIASNVLAYERGARIFRVHEVAPARSALAVAAATLHGRWTAQSRGTTPTS
jgi:dihydropteroate synthase